MRDLPVIVRYECMASRSFRSTSAVMYTLVLAIQFWFTVSTETSQHDRFTLQDENATNQTNSTSSDDVLSGEAIANIAATGAAIGIIAWITCYMCYCYNHRERMERIRTAIERNRVIRERIAAEKAAATQPNTSTAADNQTPTSDINITSTESSR